MKKKNNKYIKCVLAILLFVVVIFCGYKFIKYKQSFNKRDLFYSAENLKKLGVIYDDISEEVQELQLLQTNNSDEVYIVAKGKGLENEIRAKVTGIEGEISKKYLIKFCEPNSAGYCTSQKYKLLVINDKGELFETIFNGGSYPEELKISDYLHNDIDTPNETQLKQLTDEMNNVKFEKIRSKYAIKDVYGVYEMCGFNCDYKTAKVGFTELETESIFVETEDGVLLKLNDYSLGKPINYYLPYIIGYTSMLAFNSKYNLFIFNNKHYYVKEVKYNNTSLVIDCVIKVDLTKFHVFDVNGYIYELNVNSTVSPSKYTIKKLKKHIDYIKSYDKQRAKYVATIKYADGTSETIDIKNKTEWPNSLSFNNYVVNYTDLNNNTTYKIAIDKNINISVERLQNGINQEEYTLNTSSSAKGIILYDYVPKLFNRTKGIIVNSDERKTNQILDSLMNYIEKRDESYIK